MTQTSGRSCSIVATTVSRSVSASTGTSSARAGAGAPPAGAPARPTPRPRRRASACPSPARWPSAMLVSVDLPIPGDPPSSTSEPGTRPPPRTRSNSPSPVCQARDARRAAPRDSRWGFAATARLRARRRAAAVRGAARSSTSVFHSPQRRALPVPARLLVPAGRADVDGGGAGHAVERTTRVRRLRPARPQQDSEAARRRRVTTLSRAALVAEPSARVRARAQRDEHGRNVERPLPSAISTSRTWPRRSSQAPRRDCAIRPVSAAIGARTVAPLWRSRPSSPGGRTSTNASRRPCSRDRRDGRAVIEDRVPLVDRY